MRGERGKEGGEEENRRTKEQEERMLSCVEVKKMKRTGVRRGTKVLSSVEKPSLLLFLLLNCLKLCTFLSGNFALSS